MEDDALSQPVHVLGIEAGREEWSSRRGQHLDAPSSRLFEPAPERLPSLGQPPQIGGRHRPRPPGLVGGESARRPRRPFQRLADGDLQRGRLSPLETGLPPGTDPVQEPAEGVAHLVRAGPDRLGRVALGGRRGRLVPAEGAALDVPCQPLPQLGSGLVGRRPLAEPRRPPAPDLRPAARPAEPPRRIRRLRPERSPKRARLQPPKAKPFEVLHRIGEELHLVRRPPGVPAALVHVERLVDEAGGERPAVGRAAGLRVGEEDRRRDASQVGGRVRRGRGVPATRVPEGRARLRALEPGWRIGMAEEPGAVAVVDRERDPGRVEAGPRRAGGETLVRGDEPLDLRRGVAAAPGQQGREPEGGHRDQARRGAAPGSRPDAGRRSGRRGPYVRSVTFTRRRHRAHLGRGRNPPTRFLDGPGPPVNGRVAPVAVKPVRHGSRRARWR